MSTGFVARIAKPHFDEARVGSEEHAARGAHELSAFSLVKLIVSLKVRRLSNTVTHFPIANKIPREMDI